MSSFNEPEYLLGIETKLLYIFMKVLIVSMSQNTFQGLKQVLPDGGYLSDGCFNEPEYLLGIETFLLLALTVLCLSFNEPEYLLGIETVIAIPMEPTVSSFNEPEYLLGIETSSAALIASLRLAFQ